MAQDATHQRTALQLLFPAALFAAAAGLMVARGELFPGLAETPLDRVHQVLRHALHIGVWLAGALLFIRLLRVLVWEGIVTRAIGGQVPKLLVQIVALLVFTLAIAGFARTAFGLSLTAVWATSSVTVLILGLALRNMIFDLFTGLAVNIDRPYKIGDHIQVHQRIAGLHIVGEVVDINWRTTRIRTDDGNLVLIHNSLMANFVVTNFWEPARSARYEVPIAVDPGVPVERARRVLLAAVTEACRAPGFLESPAPVVLAAGADAGGIAFKVRYWITPWQETAPARSRDRVISILLTHLADAEIPIAYPRQEVLFERRRPRLSDPYSAAGRLRLLRRVELFSTLEAEAIELLAERMEERHFAAGDVIIRQGDPGRSMFILAEGLVDIAVGFESSEEMRVAEIGPGHFFGEMSLFTGAPRTGTITAAVDSLAFEISAADAGAFFELSPDLAQVISDRVAAYVLRDEERLEELSAAELEEEKIALSRRLLGKIKTLFRIGG